jgi:multisubunit Na+/H+ antiporter MnhC subunit
VDWTLLIGLLLIVGIATVSLVGLFSVFGTAAGAAVVFKGYRVRNLIPARQRLGRTTKKVL